MHQYLHQSQNTAIPPHFCFLIFFRFIRNIAQSAVHPYDQWHSFRINLHNVEKICENTKLEYRRIGEHKQMVNKEKTKN